MEKRSWINQSLPVKKFFVIDATSRLPIAFIYAELTHVHLSNETNIDLIFLSQGRSRENIQAQLWRKNFLPDYQVHYILINSSDSKQSDDPKYPFEDTYISGKWKQEKEIFIHLCEIIPSQKRSSKFIWISDRVVPIQKVPRTFFERNKNGSRFFAGLNTDAMLLNAAHLFEATIPVAFIEYEKLKNCVSYDSFLTHFLSGRHHIFANVAQDILLPNRKNKAKQMDYKEIFQIAHLNQHVSFKNQKDELNELLKKIWQSYL